MLQQWPSHPQVINNSKKCSQYTLYKRREKHTDSIQLVGSRDIGSKLFLVCDDACYCMCDAEPGVRGAGGGGGAGDGVGEGLAV